MENQLKKIINIDMEIKVIKLCKSYQSYDAQQSRLTFDKQGHFIRNGYLITMIDMAREKDRYEMSNQKLYIEATFKSISDINYEVWLLRTFVLEA